MPARASSPVMPNRPPMPMAAYSSRAATSDTANVRRSRRRQRHRLGAVLLGVLSAMKPSPPEIAPAPGRRARRSPRRCRRRRRRRKLPSAEDDQPGDYHLLRPKRSLAAPIGSAAPLRQAVDAQPMPTAARHRRRACRARARRTPAGFRTGRAGSAKIDASATLARISAADIRWDSHREGGDTAAGRASTAAAHPAALACTRSAWL